MVRVTPPGRVVLRVENLHKGFPDNPVLRGVSFEIRRGECVALVGGSGAGKTVLLELLIGAMKPDQGRILVPHPDVVDHPLVDASELDEDQFDRVLSNSAVVFQQDALYSATVYENIALALRETLRLPEAEIARRAHEALAEVGLPPTDAMLRTHRDELSGGMRKRVAIARALAARPRAIAYDDPTAGLDPARAAAIHELIWKAHQSLGAPGSNQTTLVINTRQRPASPLRSARDASRGGAHLLRRPVGRVPSVGLAAHSPVSRSHAVMGRNARNLSRAPRVPCTWRRNTSCMEIARMNIVARSA